MSVLLLISKSLFDDAATGNHNAYCTSCFLPFIMLFTGTWGRFLQQKWHFCIVSATLVKSVQQKRIELKITKSKVLFINQSSL